MIRIIICFCLVLMCNSIKAQKKKEAKESDSSVYSFTIDSIVGKNKIDLMVFKGSKLLIVTTATLDTSFYQVIELKKIYQQSKKPTSVVIVPTNDFGKEPTSNEQLAKFIERIGLPFIVASKTVIIGNRAHPLFKWIAQQQLGNGKKAQIKGSYQKILVDENGYLINILDASEKPSSSNEIKSIIKGKG